MGSGSGVTEGRRKVLPPGRASSRAGQRSRTPRRRASQLSLQGAGSEELICRVLIHLKIIELDDGVVAGLEVRRLQPHGAPLPRSGSTSWTASPLKAFRGWPASSQNSSLIVTKLSLRI